MDKKSNVLIGLLGTTLDISGRRRFDRWRPSYALCMQPDLPITRFELLYPKNYHPMASIIKRDIEQNRPKTQVKLTEYCVEDPWDLELIYNALLDFCQQYNFDTGRENYFLNITTGTHVAQICWYLLAEAHYIPARLIQSSPAKDQAERGNGTYTIIDLDLSRYDKIASRFAAHIESSIELLKSGIATRNAYFNRLIDQLEKVATRSSSPILLTGATGVGKSLLASRIFDLKKQRQSLKGKFVAINCATLRGDNAMSSLFGHVKGAFTGAINTRHGLLKEADQGVLFLDEVGELGLDEQAMLLTAIENKCFMPYGSDRPTHSDFQLIAGTNRNLLEEIAAGRFREDLYARINLWVFAMPSLAQRPEDIEPNIDYELRRYQQQHQTNIRFSKEARQEYLAFACSKQALWKGNFRELAASITRLATLAEQSCISQTQVSEEITRLKQDWQLDPIHPTEPQLPMAQALDLFDQYQLQGVLQVCQNATSLSDAGRQLFAVTRGAKTNPNDADRLRKYLARFGLDWQTVKTKL